MDFSWLTGFIAPTYALGVRVWNFVLAMCLMSGAIGPADYPEAWDYTVNTLNPFFTAIAATMLNMFFYIGFCRQVGNFKESMTLETGMNILFKMVLGNAGINSVMYFVRWIFNITNTSARVLMDISDISFDMYDLSSGEMLFFAMFGIIFLVVALAASATIFITLYTRMVHLCLLAATGPLAISCIPGGPGIQNAAGAWIKELISKSFSIVVIIMGVALISKMASGSDFWGMNAPEVVWVVDYVKNMFLMMLIAAFVKGADSFIKKTFGI